MDHTLKFLTDRRLTILAGAGISVLPPSCLPSWWQLNHAVLDAMAEVARAEVLPLADEIVAAVKEKQDAGRMPAEYTSEVIVDALADDYFDVLRCLEGNQCNRVHHVLAALVKAHMLPAIITTNFDTLIERACEEAGAPLRVLVKPEDYAGLDFAAYTANADAPTLLVKLHGSATDPATCIDTLAQRKRGLPPPVTNLLREIVEATRLCILGYSGADLEAEPNYLFLRQSVSRDTPGFDWLMLPDAEVLPAVTDVVALYDDDKRARVVRGTLPEWIEPFYRELKGSGVEAPPMPAEIDADAARATAVQHLQTAAREWATARSAVTCGLVLGNLAERAAPDKLLEAREQALAATERLEPGTRHHGIAHMNLAAALRTYSRNKDAAQHYGQAVQIFRDTGSLDAFGNVLNEFANLLGDIGDYQQAEELYRESARIDEITGETDGLGMPIVNIAKLRLRAGDLKGALELAHEALKLSAEAGEESERATCSEHVGLIMRDAGDSDEALARFREAEAIRRRLGQDSGLSGNLVHQGMILSGRAELDAARVCLEEAETLAERLGHTRTRALVRMATANILSQTGQWNEAIAVLQEAMALRESIGDIVGRLEIVVSIVGLFASRGETTTALQLGDPAMQEAIDRKLPALEAELAANLGIACEMSGNLERAGELYKRALELTEQVGDPHNMLTATANLANLRFRENRHAEAEALYRDVLERAQAQHDPASVVRTLANLGNIAFAKEDVPAAQKLYSDALAEADAHGLGGICSHVHLNLGFVHMRNQAWDDAAQHLDLAAVQFGDQGDAANAGSAAWFGTHVRLQLKQLPEAKERLAAALECWDGIGHPQEADARALMDQMNQASAGE